MIVGNVRIRSKADLAKLTTADLLGVFNARTGRSLRSAKNFASRDDLVDRTWDAISYEVSRTARPAASSGAAS